MDYRRLGNTTLEVSEIGMGCEGFVDKNEKQIAGLVDLKMCIRDRARTEWISGVSHDIRTPLSLVLGYSNLLEEQACTDEKIRKEASVIRQESLKIRDLIEDLNLTSKLEYHMQPLRMEQVLSLIHICSYTLSKAGGILSRQMWN